MAVSKMLPGRVRPLVIVRHENGKKNYVRAGADDFGQTTNRVGGGVVWWQGMPIEEPIGHLFKCRIKKSERFGEPGKDWWEVIDNRNRAPDMNRCGAFIVRANGTNLTESGGTVTHLPEKAYCYVLTADSRFATGPWKIGPAMNDRPDRRFLAAGETNGCVYRFNRSVLAEMDRPTIEHNSAVAILLGDLPLSRGEPFYDAASAAERGRWLASVLKDAAATATLAPHLAAIRPHLREAVTTFYARYARPGDAWLAERRLGEADRVLEAIEWEDLHLTDLVDRSPTLRARLDAELRRQVDARLEDAVRLKSELNDELDDLRRQVEAERAKVQQEQAAARDQLEDELREVSQELDDRKRELVALETQLAAKWATTDEIAARLIDHAVTDRVLMRLAGRHVSTDKAAGKTSPARAGDQPLIEPLITAGPPITDEPDFYNKRLIPALQEWQPGATRGMAAVLHEAILGCRWTLLEHAGWAKAYEQAMGGTARLSVVAAQAAWCCAADAWDGGLARVWRRALTDRSRLHLLLIADLDASVVTAWARPWLDVLAGYSRSLIVPADSRDAQLHGDGDVEWPTNLRVLACRGLGKPLEALTPELCSHWAAVKRDMVGQETPRRELPGHVTLETWAGWAPEDTLACDKALTAAIDARLAGLNGSGPQPALRRAVRADLVRLCHAAARRQGDSPDFEGLADRFIALRLKNAASYLADPSAGAHT